MKLDELDDVSVDGLYPESLRRFAPRFWTPAKVAQRAARMFADAGARTILDVGSGAGKFAIVAALTAPELRVVGVEQRPHLVEIARSVAKRLALANVEFRAGDATRVSWRPYDGIYFFNPFAENLFDPVNRFDEQAALTRDRFVADISQVEAVLRTVALGTRVVTYHGMGGRIPGSYELREDVRAHTDWLRLWVKARTKDDKSFYLEMDDRVVHVPRRITKGAEHDAG
jgi:SAM-dependent methyltransferase